MSPVFENLWLETVQVPTRIEWVQCCVTPTVKVQMVTSTISHRWRCSISHRSSLFSSKSASSEVGTSKVLQVWASCTQSLPANRWSHLKTQEICQMWHFYNKFLLTDFYVKIFTYHSVSTYVLLYFYLCHVSAYFYYVIFLMFLLLRYLLSLSCFYLSPLFFEYKGIRGKICPRIKDFWKTSFVFQLRTLLLIKTPVFMNFTFLSFPETFKSQDCEKWKLHANTHTHTVTHVCTHIQTHAQTHKHTTNIKVIR